MLLAIQTIRGKPPPISYTDFEELSFYKRSLKAAKVDESDNRLKSLLAFERENHVELADELLTRDTFESFLETICNRSWTSIKDHILLSYGKALLGDEEQKRITMVCEEKHINLKEVQDRFLMGEEEMVKGVRVDTGQQHQIEQQEFTRPRQTDAVVFPVRVDQPKRGRPPNPKIEIVLDGTTDAQQEKEANKSEEPPSPPQKEKETSNTLAEYRKYAKEIDDTYWDEESTSSLALDVIAVYLKGQKILYIEAKTHCERNLTLLMLPAIFISAACTVLSVSLESYGWGTVLVSSLTALNSFLLTLVNYLKLDARAEAHRVASYQFDKLQTLCEFHSGKVLFFRQANAFEIVNDIEKKIKEIKDNNQFIIPQAIRDKFPTLYTTNVFTEVKKIENKETMIKHKMNLLRIKVVGEGEKAAVEKERDDLLEKYMKLRDEYMKLDKAFNKEIQREIDNRRGCWRKKIVEEVEDGV